MKNLLVLLLGLMLLCMAGCNSSRNHNLSVTKGKAINEANANNKVIADSLKQQAPGHSQILNAQSDKIDAAMEDAPEQMNAAATFTTNQLHQRMQSIIDQERENVEKLKKQLAEEKVGFWGGVLQWGGWTVVGGLGIFLARALNVPGAALLSDPLVRVVAGNKLKEVEAQADLWTQKAAIAHTAIESSELGSTGLKYLDERLKSSGINLSEHVQHLSNGKASSIQDLFKYLAKSHALDQGKHSAIVDTLKEVRDNSHSVGGEHPKVIELLNIIPIGSHKEIVIKSMAEQPV